MDGWLDAEAVFTALYAGDARAFWLDSGIAAITGMSYLGSATVAATADATRGTVTVTPGGRVEVVPMLEFLGRAPRLPVGEVGGALGWVGWFGYGMRRQTMAGHPGGEADGPGGGPGGVPVARAGNAEATQPDAAFLWVDRLVAIDHARGTVELCALAAEWTLELVAWRDDTVARLDAVRQAASTGLMPVGEPAPAPTAPAAAPVATATWHDTDEGYLASIAACQRAIRDGEAYQLCLTTEVTVTPAAGSHPDPVASYLALRRESPTHHGGMLRIDDVTLLSASPETFLTVSRDGVVETRPIKGTRPRGDTPHRDTELRAELAGDDKERAENLMIVDLMRNDLGRVAELGSVTVPQLLAVETYAQVHQLVSTVRARLAPGLRAMDAVAACFPAGSMTGAPKLRATEIVAELEGRERGLYAGAFGYLGADGSADLAMTIRSIVIDARGITVGAGGGITALSVPALELAEVKLKAGALLRVLGVAGER